MRPAFTRVFSSGTVLPLLACREDKPLLRGQVSHAPYRYRGVQLETWSAIPLELDGFGDITSPPVHTCYVDGFDVKVYATLPVEDSAA